MLALPPRRSFGIGLFSGYSISGPGLFAWPGLGLGQEFRAPGILAWASPAFAWATTGLPTGHRHRTGPSASSTPHRAGPGHRLSASRFSQSATTPPAPGSSGLHRLLVWTPAPPHSCSGLCSHFYHRLASSGSVPDSCPLPPATSRRSPPPPPGTSSGHRDWGRAWRPPGQRANVRAAPGSSIRAAITAGPGRLASRYAAAPGSRSTTSLFQPGFRLAHNCYLFNRLRLSRRHSQHQRARAAITGRINRPFYAPGFCRARAIPGQSGRHAGAITNTQAIN